jgi:KDO2-lipid IV(A) lauroyltransferase
MSRLVVAILWLHHLLPLGAQAAIGRGLGNLLYALLPGRRRVTRINLEKCFPAMPEAERERIARRHYQVLVRAFLEHGLLWWSPRGEIERLIRLEGLENAKALGGEPAIVLVPHFVGLDACATRLICELDMVGIYARQRDPVFERLVAHGRTRFGNQKLVSRQDGVRAAIGAMKKEKKSLFYLPDQDPSGQKALFVPFFGVPAATQPGLARIAKITGAKVLPCVTKMLPGGEGYVVRIDPAWEDFPTGDLEADTRRMNECIERAVLEMPEQYLWTHKRFKRRPEGEAPFY